MNHSEGSKTFVSNFRVIAHSEINKKYKCQYDGRALGMESKNY